MVNDPTPAPAPRRLGITELEQRLNLDRSTIWRMYRSGRLPEPHYIGERRCWFEDEITVWERARMAHQATARRGAQNLKGAGTPEPSPSTSSAA